MACGRRSRPSAQMARTAQSACGRMVDRLGRTVPAIDLPWGKGERTCDRHSWRWPSGCWLPARHRRNRPSSIRPEGSRLKSKVRTKQPAGAGLHSRLESLLAHPPRNRRSALAAAPGGQQRAPRLRPSPAMTPAKAQQPAWSVVPRPSAARVGRTAARLRRSSSSRMPRSAAPWQLACRAEAIRAGSVAPPLVQRAKAAKRRPDG